MCRVLSRCLGVAVWALVSVAGGARVSAQGVALRAELSHGGVWAEGASTVYLKVAVEGLRPTQRAPRAPLNVSLVVDRSGSMQGERIARAKEAARLAVGMLGPEDVVSVVAYDTEAQVLVPATKASDHEVILRGIEGIRPLNSTALYAGVRLGGREVQKFLAPGRVNRVVLLSDGIANVGPSSPAELAALGRELAGAGVSVSTIGLGLGYNEDLMSQLAGAADGNHAFVERPEQLAAVVGQELGDALAVVAQEVEVEVVFSEGVRPVRALGREVSFEGRRGVARLGGLGAGQVRYVLVEAALARPGAVGGRVEVARAEVRFVDPAAGASRVGAQVSARVVGSAEEARASEVSGVMEEVLVSLSVEKQKLAVEMKDRGDSAGASRAMAEGASMLQGGAGRYQSKRLEAAAASAAADSEEIKKGGQEWVRMRKAARRKVYQAETQQAY